jgi:hypothetical protein
MRKLPLGLPWVYFNRLPDNLSEEQFQKYLSKQGLDVAIENISVKNFPGGKSSAMVAVPKEIVLQLIMWALNGTKLQGMEVNGELLLGDSRWDKGEKKHEPRSWPPPGVKEL